jgi:LDH2 family malate/lactate/ureidoglycolate dehydrogenase
MPNLSPDTLRALASAILEAVGSEPETARFVGDSLVDANLAGHDSHGVMRLLLYASTARSGQVEAAARAVVARKTGATATVDGANGWGQPAMWLATETAIELAREFGVGAVTVARCYHIGRVAPYVERVAHAGMIGLAMSSAGPGVAPYGGRTRVLGTNPIAWAAPRGGGKPPLCLDVATSTFAEGKVMMAKTRGELVPPGVIVTADGHPTQIPDDLYDGGALLPFGAHKGSGFSILAQIVGHGLAGMLPPSPVSQLGANGPLVLAIDVESFGPLDQCLGEIEAQCKAITDAPPAEGFDRVRLPGEPEVESRARRAIEGIPIPESTWTDLLALADELGVRDEAWDP